MANFNNYMYFGTIGRSMYTLFCVATLAEFTEIGRPVLQKQPGMLLFFFTFAIFTTFGVMNVIIGVIVESTMSAAKDLDAKLEKLEMRMKLERLQELRDLVFEMDTDDSKTISVAEIDKGLQDDVIRDTFDKLDLPPDFTANDIFTLLDRDGDGLVTTAEFMCSMFSLINNNDFQTKCNVHVSLNMINRRVIRCFQMLERLIPHDVLKMIEHEAQELAHASHPEAPPTPTPPPCQLDRLEQLILEHDAQTQRLLTKMERRLTSLESEVQPLGLSDSGILGLCASPKRGNAFGTEETSTTFTRTDVRVPLQNGKCMPVPCFQVGGVFGSPSASVEAHSPVGRRMVTPVSPRTEPNVGESPVSVGASLCVS
mmetsp:Transcript_86400/g.197047  ORF Transcript_86400/g.197047 Transcript_86400/m.197047 type:complete len:369 (+) Transcript_86400:1-1107(+)